MHSSAASSTCRIDWRPSRWLALALVVLAVLAGASLLMSGLPPGLKLPAATLALLRGLQLSRRSLARPGRALDWPGGDAPARILVEDRVFLLAKPRLHLRGPIAMLSGLDSRGGRRHLVWWPDTLPSASRRQLRLAAAVSRRYETTLPSVAA